MCLAPSARAQSASAPADSADVLVLDHDYTGPNEFVRVFLQDGQVYRAELSSPDVTLEIRPLVRTTQLPRIYPFLPAHTPSGASILEIYPQVDAEYEIRSVSGQGSAVATRMRLYRDIQGSRRRELVRKTRGWDTGVEVAGGWHSGFLQTSAVPALAGSSAESGTDAEVCFTARSGGGLGRYGMCVVGLGYQSQGGAKSILWVYTEPRVRLLGRVRPNQSDWEVGALLRFGVGMISASPDTPTILAPGAYIARNIRTGASSWRVQASYSHGWFRGFSKPSGFTGEDQLPTSDRIALGIGWYR
jgi:hypothetical protein